MAGFFLFPGWPSGVFFCTLLSLLSVIPFLVQARGHYGFDFIMYGMICLASLVFPAVLVNLLRTQGAQRVSNYVLFLLASGILAMVLAGIAESMSNKGFLWLFLWIPPVLFALSEMGRSGDAVLVVSMALTLILFGSLIVLALVNYRKTLTEIEKSINP
jgi:hypothetical protein